MMSHAAGNRYIRWFETIGIDDVPLVGSKHASLGELYRDWRQSTP
jgi:pyruvate,water dikinase